MDDPRLRRLCVSTWSFHTAFERDRDNPAKVLMDILDFPEMIADRYHVHNIEVVLPHFVNPDARRVAEFKARLDKARSRVVNMPLDFGVLWNKPAISSTDAAEREAALALYRSGIDTAHAIGSPAVRCDPGIVNLDDPSLTIDSYKQLAAYAGAGGALHPARALGGAGEIVPGRQRRDGGDGVQKRPHRAPHPRRLGGPGQRLVELADPRPERPIPSAAQRGRLHLQDVRLQILGEGGGGPQVPITHVDRGDYRLGHGTRCRLRNASTCQGLAGRNFDAHPACHHVLN